MVQFRLHAIAAIVATTVLGGFARTAEAQLPATADEMRPRLILKGTFGFVGELGIGEEAFGLDEDVSMPTSLGAAIQGETPLARFFSLGGMLGLLWYDTDAVDGFETDRSLLLDINLVPKLRIPYAFPRSHGEVYVGAPGGLTLSFLDQGFRDFLGDDVGTGIGWNFGVVVGAQFFITPALGFMAEVGYQYHRFRHSVDVPIVGDQDATLDFGQFMLNVGVVFGL